MSNDWVTLRTSQLRAEIDPLGAQLSVLRDAAGNDLLWGGDPAVWASRAPILFPIVGELAEGQYWHEGKRYALPRHGFARRERFETLTVTSRSVLMRLETNEALYEIYPWRFSLDVSFSLDGATLSVTANVRNTDYHDMPMSIGFHPGFRWPLTPAGPRDACFLEFEHDEPAPIRRLSRHGLLTSHLLPTPVRGRRLALTDALFADDVVVFERLRSRSVNYGGAGGPKLQVGFPDATFLGVWSRPGAGFVCIEPWQGVADPEGAAGDLWVKPGVVRLAPGAVHTLHMTVALQSG